MTQSQAQGGTRGRKIDLSLLVTKTNRIKIGEGRKRKKIFGFGGKRGKEEEKSGAKLPRGPGEGKNLG